MADFLEEFNKASNNKFNYIRIGSYNIDEENSILNLTLVVPYEYFNDESKFSVYDRQEIHECIKKIIPEKFGLKLKFDKILVSHEVVLRFINNFIKEKYARILIGRYVPKDIKINIEGNEVSIVLPIDKNICSYFVSRQVDKELEKYLNSKYYATNSVKLKEVELTKETEVIRKKRAQYIDDGIIICEKGKSIIGLYIASPPVYISNCSKPQEIATICGKVSKFEKKVAKSGKLFYKFIIQDLTGNKMNCIYFPKSKKAQKSKIENIQVISDYVVQGELKEDAMNKGVIMFVHNIMRAKADEEATLKKMEFVKLQKIKAVVPDPQEYNDPNNKEYTLFDERPYICPLIAKNDFVVFDLETTGLSVSTDKIAEIGAVKISHGIKVSTFQTLVDPEIKMPECAYKVNGISNEMLVEAPLIENVLEKFMNYIHGCILVGQNAKQFDLPFIKRDAEALGYVVDNPLYDTKIMAKQVDPDQKNYSLAKLCEIYKVNNNQAHRALSDALATADVFIALANKLKLE